MYKQNCTQTAQTSVNAKNSTKSNLWLESGLPDYSGCLPDLSQNFEDSLPCQASHFTKFRKNQAVTVREMLINPVFLPQWQVNWNCDPEYWTGAEPHEKLISSSDWQAQS